ncbi:hypothetical protein ACIP8U_00710 [Streptomyces pseudovenezuelae]|uniref:hypothetical protein n=1 Tax=Streptomyces pseudovenezuelae TaxID=67350 RepID=UPI003809C704
MPSSQIIDGSKMTLVELAEISFEEYSNSAEEQADEQFEQERESFLAAVRATARQRFSATAEQLEWTYTPHAELPADVEEATAPLSPERPEYFRYRYNHATETPSFELVQPCSTCGHDRINEVTGLTDLGRLLATGGTR